MKIVLIVTGVILSIAVIGLITLLIMDRDIRSTVIREVDLSKVPDGEYKGHYHSGRWHNEVVISVKDNRIVTIKNINKLNDNHAEKVVDEAINAMMATQSVKIDVISGASLNTRSFQRAVEDALKVGITE